MRIKLLDNSLIRRFGGTIIDVDSGIGKSLIDKNLAVELKAKEKPEEDKMIKEPIVNKTIFPETIIKKE